MVRELKDEERCGARCAERMVGGGKVCGLVLSVLVYHLRGRGGREERRGKGKREINVRYRRSSIVTTSFSFPLVGFAD